MGAVKVDPDKSEGIEAGWHKPGFVTVAAHGREVQVFVLTCDEARRLGQRLMQMAADAEHIDQGGPVGKVMT